ncbi:MAG: hypothetical protein AB9883_03155 [Acidaminococcaceae bacterium]
MKINEMDLACLNSDMYDLMDNLKVLNKELPQERQLPQSLFVVLTWAVYEWRQMMSAEHIKKDDEKSELLEWLVWWREKSGYNDVHFLYDRFGASITETQKRVLAAFEVWGGEKHFWEWVEAIIATIDDKA